MDRSQQLNRQFLALQQARNPDEIQAIESRIWDLWMEGPDEEIDDLMEDGMDALADASYTEAIALFTHIIERAPDYAEGWNKRATAYYLRGNYKPSIEDVRRTLALEPRHFGALSGLASIYLVVGADWQALRVFQRLHHLIPHQPELQEQIHDLQRRLGLSLS